MANTADGLAWDASVPVAADLRSNGHVEIKSLRVGLALRLDKEHHTLATYTTSITGGGEHKAGSAMAYYQDDDPTTRPNGADLGSATPVDANSDNGRLFVDTSGSSRVMKVWTGSAFENTSGTQQASGTVVPSDVKDSPQTLTVGFTPDLMWFGFGSPPAFMDVRVFSLASLDPIKIAWFIVVSSAKLIFSMTGSDVLVTFDTQESNYFSNASIAHWRALKF